MSKSLSTRSNIQSTSSTKSVKHRPAKLSNTFDKRKSSSFEEIIIEPTADCRPIPFSTIDDLDAMTGLPNFCTTCDKQIINPSISILYCSESCRRKDGLRPLSTSSQEAFYHLHSSNSATSIFNLVQLSSSFPDIVPQRSPTMLRSPSLASSADSSSLFDGLRIDRSESEAAKYLSRFMSSGDQSTPRRARPTYYRNQNSNVLSASNLPTLSHTPGTASPGSVYSVPSRATPWSKPSWYSRKSSSQSIGASPVVTIGQLSSMNVNVVDEQNDTATTTNSTDDEDSDGALRMSIGKSLKRRQNHHKTSINDVKQTASTNAAEPA